MFRILFCASVQCSAIPLPNISTLCFSFSTFIRACPFRCARLLSFLCLFYPLRAERFYAVSILHSSTPCLGVSAGIVSAPIYSVSAPVPAIPYLTLLFTSLPFIFSTKLLCALLLLCMSDQSQIRSTHFRIFSHLLQSILLRFRAFLLSSFSLESCLCPASLLQCSAHRLRSISHQSRSISCLLHTAPLPCDSILFLALSLRVSALFHFATQLIVSLCHCLSNKRLSNPFHCSSTLFLCCAF